ncbi:MAG: cupin domain-containing protein [Ilyomonas sp.]
MKTSYGTLAETVNGLKKDGYTMDLNLQEECLVCHQNNTSLSPDDFDIDAVYRFEGESNPDDEAVVYAISSPKFNIKGVLVNGYGIYADDFSSALVEKLGRGSATSFSDSKKSGAINTRSNEATPQRPEGNRMLNAPLLEIDLNKFLTQLIEEPTWKESDRNSITVFKSGTMRIVLIGLHENALLKTHTANGIISVQVLDGLMKFTAGEQTVQLGKGQMITLQKNIPHSVFAVKETFFVLTLAIEKE